MRPGDDILMAYADGELDESGRRQVEQAMQTDPALAARVRQHAAVRQDLQRAYAGVLEAAVPAHLRALLAGAGADSQSGRAPSRPKVIDLASVRIARRQQAGAPPPPPRRQWNEWHEWREGREGRGEHGNRTLRPRPSWAALALLLFGLICGIAAVVAYHGETAFAVVNGHGVLRAHGKLDTALNIQLASVPQPRGKLRIGVSFVSRDGPYCRAFELGAAAGLACRAGAGWHIPVLVEGPGAVGERPAGAAMAAPVLAAIDARALGPALDAGAERAAAARGWSR